MPNFTKLSVLSSEVVLDYFLQRMLFYFIVVILTTVSSHLSSLPDGPTVVSQNREAENKFINNSQI
jgi:hypothetical protein